MTTKTDKREQRDVLLLGRAHHGDFLTVSVRVDETGDAELPVYLAVAAEDGRAHLYQRTDFEEPTYRWLSTMDIYQPQTR